MERHRELLRRYFAPQWRTALVLLGLLLVGTVTQLVQPRLLAGFIDSARAGDAVGVLGRLAIAFLALAFTAQVLAVVEVYLTEHLALVATNRLRSDLTRHCLSLDLPFHHEHPPGELIERIDGDVASLSGFLSAFLVAIIGSVLLFIGAVISIALVDIRLALAMGTFSVVVALVAIRLRDIAWPRWSVFMEARARQAAFLEEHLAGTEDVRALGATSFVMRRFFEHGRRTLRAEQMAVLLGNGASSVANLMFAVGTAGALAAAAALERGGRITLGTVYLVFAYTEVVSRPVYALNRQVKELQTASAAISRITQLLETSPTLDDGPGAPLPDGPLAVDLDQIRFAYDEEELEHVLDDVCVQVAPGATLGLLGRTGSGKTTITRLLLRLYDPQAGTVRVGGVDARELRLAELRHRVALVSQDVQLFEASVRDNVTFFDDGVPDHEVHAALADVDLDEWVASLPDGLDTTVGPTTLSGGEAQLLALARVFLRDPGVVILDEATSRLDPATERRVERAIDRLFEGRTAIVIAHRLTTVLRADEILVLEDGRVVEHGDRVGLTEDPDSRFAGLLRAGMHEVLA